MTFSTTRSKVPHICGTSVSESQISVSLALRPAVFGLQAILNALNDPKYLEHYKVKRTPYSITSVPESHHAMHLLVTGHFETDPKMTLNTIRSNIPIYVLLIPLGRNIHPVFLYYGRFRDRRLSKIGNAPNNTRMTLNI